MQRLLLIGLDTPEIEAFGRLVDLPTVAWPTLPRIKLENGELFVERHGAAQSFLRIDKVIFHGIFEDDFDVLTALSIWNGPCLPGAIGMMDCRLRLPCLARSLRVSRFNTMPRGFGDRGTAVRAEGTGVAKWGNWHCGENKETFTGAWTCTEPAVIERFIEGSAVRVMLVGDKSWQIQLTGPDWKKSIHPEDAHFMDIDPALLEDARRLGAHFGLEMVGVDYMIAADGTPHLLEVNHIPNVTRFPEIRDAYLEFAAAWAL
jgi:hypothetical protein